MNKTLQIIAFLLCQIICFCQTQIGSNINGEDPNHDFGSALEISEDGSTIAIGSQRWNSGQGKVEIFNFQNGDWKLLGNPILGNTDRSWFGVDVALTPSANRIIIGSYKENITRIYDFINGDWEETGSVSLSTQHSGIHFGYSVDISSNGKIIAVSGTHFPASNIHRGIVNIYEKINNQWIQIGESIEGDFDRDQSGWDIDLNQDGNLIAISSLSNSNNGEDSGQVRIFNYENNSWIQHSQPLYGYTEHLSFGWKISLSENGKYLIVGAPIDWTGVSTDTHYAEVFEFIDNNWQTKGKRILGLNNGENFGYDVEITSDGNRVAISSPSNENCPIQLYDYIEDDWQLVASINSEIEFNSLGLSIDMTSSGEKLIGSSRGPIGFAVVYSLDNLSTPSCEKHLEEENETEPSETDAKVFLPNIVNSNSLNNNSFYLQSAHEIEYSLAIYDRWGNLIFHTNNALSNVKTKGWTPANSLNQGVYVYIVEYESNNNSIIKIGDITIIK